MRIRFLLVCEGSSDRGLVPHLEALCVRAGAKEAMGEAPDLSRLPSPPSRASEAKVAEALRHVGDVNLIFIHEDSDGRDVDEMRERIRERVELIEGCPPHVCVIPVQELETWLLVDEDQIRNVAGYQRGKNDLGIPPLRQIEETPDAKKCLKDALAKASGEQGIRLQKHKARFPELRGRLLQLLDVEGAVNKLPSWRRLVDDVEAVVGGLIQSSR